MTKKRPWTKLKKRLVAGWEKISQPGRLLLVNTSGSQYNCSMGQGNLLDKTWRGKKDGGGIVAIRTAADAFGAVKDRAREVTNQQLGTGALTKSFSGTTLFELGNNLPHRNSNRDMSKGKVGLIIIVTSCYLLGNRDKNTIRKAVNHFKELATEKETVRLIAIVTILLQKWYLIPLSYWIVNSTRILGDSTAAVLPVVVVDNVLKLGYSVYTIVVEPISFLSYQIAGAGGGLLVIFGSGVLQWRKIVLNPVAKGNPFFFYNLYREKLLLIRGVTIILYSVSAALELILRFFLIITSAAVRGESIWRSFKEKVLIPKSKLDSSRRPLHICSVILPFVYVFKPRLHLKLKRL